MIAPREQPTYENTVLAEAFVIEAIAVWMKTSLGESERWASFEKIVQLIDQSTYQYSREKNPQLVTEVGRLLNHLESSLQ